jgi:hypothetical protein
MAKGEGFPLTIAELTSIVKQKTGKSRPLPSPFSLKQTPLQTLDDKAVLD